MTEPRTVGRHAHVTLAAGLTDVHVLMVDVADLADGGHAVQRERCAARRRADEAGRMAPSLAMSWAMLPAARAS